MEKRSTKIALGFVLSIVLGAALGYGLTWVLPPPDRGSGSIVQTRFLSLNSNAQISDTNLVKQTVPETFLSITTTGNSYVVMEFSAHAWVYLEPGFINYLLIDICLELDGHAVANATINRFESIALSSYKETSEHFHLRFVTGTLPAGTHVANVTWVSRNNANGNNIISFSSMGINMTRTLMLQEIKV